MQGVQDLIGLVSDKVGNIAQSDIVIGDPIELGEVTIVPLSRVSIGFGGGGGQGEGEPPRKKGQRHAGRGRGTGGASGGGGKVRPVGVIVFGPDGVEVKPIPDKKGLLDKLFDKVPEFIERVQEMMPDKDGNRSDGKADDDAEAEVLAAG